MSEVKSRVGPPVWVESLMTEKEYREYSKIYSTYNPPMYKVANFNEHTRWRYGMGSGLSSEEISKIKSEIDSLKKFVTENKHLYV